MPDPIGSPQLCIPASDFHCLAQTAADLANGRWTAAGSDLLSLSKYVDSSVCHAVACQVVQGLLEATGTALQVNREKTFERGNAWVLFGMRACAENALHAWNTSVVLE